MDKWEYKFVVLDKWNPEQTLAVLNEAGQDGWEVIKSFIGVASR